jgi:hypothetical protein
LPASASDEKDSRPIITAIQGAAPAAIARHGIVNVSLGPCAMTQ